MDVPTRVLLIDDDPDLPPLIEALLASIPGARWVVEWVADPEEAAARLSRGGADVALLDVRLRGGASGLDLVATVGAENLRLPVVLLTAGDDRAVDLRASELGVAAFLHKEQLEAATLERAIRYAIRFHALQRQAAATRRARTLRSLGAGAAHELNNPLAVIRGNLEYLKAALEVALPDVPEQEEWLDAVEDALAAAEQIRSIVGELGAFAKPEDGPLQSRVDRLLEEAVAEAKGYLRGLPPAAIVAPPAYVRGEHFPLRRVFRHLVTLVARGAAERGRDGQLELWASAAPGEVQVVVRVPASEDGAAEPAAEALRLLAGPDASEAEVSLGLAVSRSIVEGYGGRLVVDFGTAEAPPAVLVCLPRTSEDVGAPGPLP
ncbi:MAG: sensor histidine kinase [Deltaproteobacteria bacterium]|nr:MAG: sensor histidine kinase [Deltaproteobacteria bacterium]